MNTAADRERGILTVLNDMGCDMTLAEMKEIIRLPLKNNVALTDQLNDFVGTTVAEKQTRVSLLTRDANNWLKTNDGHDVLINRVRNNCTNKLILQVLTSWKQGRIGFTNIGEEISLCFEDYERFFLLPDPNFIGRVKQNFNSYAYIAPTLADSNLLTGMFNSCFIVVAHTNNSAVYWNSNVLCGYSADNLAPSAPIVSSMVDSSTQDVIVYWDAPQVSDYSSSTVFSLSGFSISGVTDTLAFDSSPVAGSTYTYGVVHYDVNGNGSDTSWTTITIDDDVDVIPLTAGWNLISTNHIYSQLLLA